MTDLRKAAEQAGKTYAESFRWDYLQDIDKNILEKFAKLVRADEREACAKLVEADGLARGNEGLVLIKAAGRIRARGEK